MLSREKEIAAVTILYALTFLFAAAAVSCSSEDGKESDAAHGGDTYLNTSDGHQNDQHLVSDTASASQDSSANWHGYFPQKAIWYTDFSQAKVHADSAAIIDWLDKAGGWGTGKMQIDFSIEVLEADANTPMRSFTPTDEHWTPDCDIAKVPVPPNGALEEESGYKCTQDGDCHLIVVHRPTMKLYELYRVLEITETSFKSGCLAVWDMTRVYGEKGRGAQCTSADAAGFPIAPLLFTADEVKAGEINHAIRFILPNNRLRKATHVRPATHGNKDTTGGANAPPYGSHFRLKASYDISKLSPGAQVVARALKKYGMFHADGGQIALTAQGDRFTKTKWKGLLGAQDLASLKVTDFEVIDHGSTIKTTYNCVREP